MVTYFQVTEINENPGNQCKFGGIKSVTGQKQTGISIKKNNQSFVSYTTFNSPKYRHEHPNCFLNIYYFHFAPDARAFLLTHALLKNTIIH